VNQAAPTASGDPWARVAALFGPPILAASFLVAPLAVRAAAGSPAGYTITEQVGVGAAVFVMRWSVAVLSVWGVRALAGSTARMDRLARRSALTSLTVLLALAVWRTWTLLGGG
jgi:hypothetical protein